MKTLTVNSHLLSALRRSLPLNFFLFFLLIFSTSKTSAQLSFTITSSSGTNSLTCTNTLITLTASSTSSTAVTYTWMNALSNSVVSTSNSLTVTSPGVYSITASSGTSTSSQTLAIFSDTMVPNATLSPYSSSISCMTATVQLQAFSTTPGTTFLWLSAFPCAQGNTCVAATPGVYTVLATSGVNGCKSTAVAFVSDNRIYPVILSSQHFSLSCPDGTVEISPLLLSSHINLTYSWTIPPNVTATGLNSLTLTTNGPGNYKVTVTNTLNGCASNAFIDVWACVGLSKQSIEKDLFTFYPNPISNELTLSSTNQQTGSTYKIINALGEVMRSGYINAQTFTIYLGDLSDGVYFLEITNNRSKQVEKILKKL